MKFFFAETESMAEFKKAVATEYLIDWRYTTSRTLRGAKIMAQRRRVLGATVLHIGTMHDDELTVIPVAHKIDGFWFYSKMFK